MTIGYIGLGVMGGAIVRRLLRQHTVHVYDTNPVCMDALAGEGATPAAELADLARQCGVLMLCLPTSADVRRVLLSPGGLVESVAPGAMVIDQTTGDPGETLEMAAELHRRDITLVDAPVVGGPSAAAEGKLAILCGGSDDSVNRIRPLLESISPFLLHCGPTGSAHMLKLIKNGISTCNRLLTYECATLGYKYGLPLDVISRVVNRSLGRNVASERILPRLSSYGQTASLRLGLALKDIDLAVEVGADYGVPMLSANAARALVEIGMHQMGASANIDELAHVYERMAGVTFGTR